jgi:hypothetical protein
MGDFINSIIQLTSVWHIELGDIQVERSSKISKSILVNRPGAPPLDPAKGKRIKNKELIDVLGETKTDIGVPVVGVVPDAVRSSNAPR